MAGSLRVAQAVSAGGVVCEERGNAVMVALCGRLKTGLWALPKGTPDGGESLEETALREVREETGLHVEIAASLGHIEYWFTRDAGRIHKRVYFYLMRPCGGSFDNHDPEFDVVQWASPQEALGMLTYPSERDVLRRALAALDAEEAAV